MRCLHCGKRLSLLRKFSDAEFCSDEHRQEFQQQQSDLALARLIEAQNSMGRPRPPKPAALAKPVKKAKAATAEKEPVIPMARTVYEVIPPVAADEIHVPPLVTQMAGADSGLPYSELSLRHKGFAAPGQLPLASPMPSELPASRRTPGRALFRLSVSLPGHPAAMEQPEIRSSSGLLALAGALAGPAAEWRVPAVQAAPPVLPAIALPAARLQAERIEAPPPLPPPPEPEREPAFGSAVGIALAPSSVQPAELPVESGWLRCVGTPASPVLQSRQSARLHAPGLAAVETPQVQAVESLHNPVPAVQAPAASPEVPSFPPAAPLLAGLRPVQRQARLPLKAMAAAAGVSAPVSRPALPEPREAFPALGILSELPGLRSEGQQPLALDIQASTAAGCVALPWLSGLLDAARDAAYPQTLFRTLPPEPTTPSIVEPEPDEDAPPMQRGLPVQVSRPVDCGRGGPLWAGPMMAVAAPPDPRMPSCRMTIDQADGSGPRQTRQVEAARKRGFSFTIDARKLPGRKFWMHAPADLKWVALGLPLLLVLVLYSFRPSTPSKPPVEVASATPAAAAAAPQNKTALGGQLNALQKVILSRAAVKLFDDFRGGLGSWSGDEGWSKSWKYGDASFLEPGQLALYTPTVGMRDYTFQFLGQIERKSLNWVFRASDSKNYYSMRIVITRGGPLPEAQLVRSTIIGGKERDVKAMPVPFPVQSDTLYLVKMDIRGADFTTYIQGQVVDTFTDTRLEQGGVGFYGGRGEQSMLRWVEVTHQYDFLGRLCALMAPYDMAAQGRQAN